MDEQNSSSPSRTDLAPARSMPLAHPLLVALALLLLAVWLLPDSAWVVQSNIWLPTWVHSVSEFVAVAVAILVFSVAWHTYRAETASNLVLLACGFLAVGLLDLAHLLSYRGMPDFITPAGPEKAIDFWLAARITAAGCLLSVALRPWRALSNPATRFYLLGAALLLTGLVIYLQLWQPQLFPRTFIDGQGLTPLKVLLEWLVIALLGGAALCFWRARHRQQVYDAYGLFLVVGVSILAELCFTAYRNVHDIYSLLGHLYKVVAYLLLYRVVFISCVREPYRRLAEEISGRQAAEQKIEVLAFYDNLTGLPNLDLLRDRTDQALTVSLRGQLYVGLLYMDVDGFKNLNDSLGHSYGDALLLALTETLRGLIRDSDTLCRPGGDEFILLLPDLDSPEEVASLADSIMYRLQQPFSLYGRNISTSISLGIAVAPHDGRDFETLLRNAETAMYKAKQDGRETWRFFDSSMNDEAVERLELLNGLRQAIEAQQLLLHYQPQIDLHTGALVGVEALIRWQHPQWGLVPPGRFIAAAEESRLIVPVGAWVIQQACWQAMAWRRAGLLVPQVAVNVSAIQLRYGNIEQQVSQALASSGLPASQLELEITESSLLDDSDQVLATLKRLTAMGVKLSIDDFGTGYSSFAYLLNLAVDKLKIDQSFIRDLTSSADSRAVVTAIIQMAKSLGLTTIAEGVEDSASAEALRQLGCTEAQGYLYARPLPVAQLEQFVRAHRALAVG